MKTFLKTVNFGSIKTGLSTVGYTLYDESGNVYKSRSTSGVFEVGSTGIYGAKIDFPESQEVILIWDTGEATPRYAMDTSTIQLNTIQEETDRIRVIWNSLKNAGDLYAKLLNKIGKIEGMKFPDIPDNSEEMKAILKEVKSISIPKVPTVEEIKSALSITVSPPKVDLSKVKIPNYSTKLEKITKLLINLSVTINSLFKDTVSRVSRLTQMVSNIEETFGVLNERTRDEFIREIKGELQSIKKSLEEAIVENTRLDKTVKDLVTAEGINRIIRQLSDINDKKESLRLALGVK